jgi:hypothetical protein
VVLAARTGNGFNYFPAGREAKPLKRPGDPAPANGLKPGANERRQETEVRRLVVRIWDLRGGLLMLAFGDE